MVRKLALTSAIISAFVLAACSSPTTAAPTSGASSQAQGQTQLTINSSTAPATIDPSEALNMGDFIIPTATYVTLVKYGTQPGPKGTTVVDYTKILPYLADSWTISKDAKTYTFHLSNKFKFNDGTPINAAAVKYTFERAIKMNGGGLYYLNNGQYKPPLFKSVDTPDDHTVVMHLNVSLEGLLTNWAQPAGSILEPAVVEKNGGVQANTVNKWVAGNVAGGGGPYVLEQYLPGTSAKLVANSNYPLPVRTKTLNINFVTDAATLALNARSGEADVTLGAPPSVAHSLESSDKVKVVSFPTPLLQYLGFNTTMAPGNNKDLRTALTYATPYSAILDRAVFGYGTSYYGPIIPTMIGFNADLSKPRQIDLVKAKALIKSSGLPTPIKLSVTLESGDQAAAVIGPILKDYWSQVGVEVELQTLSPPAYVSATEDGKVPAYIRQAGPGVPTPSYYFGYSMRCGVSFNLTRLCSQELDNLLNKGIAAPDEPSRQQYWNQITTLWQTYSPRVIFYGVNLPVILSNRVTNFAFINEYGMKDQWG